MATTLSSTPLTKMFINNEWVDGAKHFPVISPQTGKVIYECSEAREADVDAAVAAATACFYGPDWGLASTGTQRAAFLRAYGKVIEANADLLARLESADMGKPLSEAAEDVKDSVALCEMYATMAEGLDKGEAEEELEVPDGDFEVVVVKEPLGVVGAISPFNFPLLMSMQKVSAALAAGCSVVLKPSELTPQTALKMAEMALQVGLPKGALNVLPGAGPTGVALSNHPDVTKLSFTGSVATGKKVMAAGAGSDKGPRAVSLELGGKSPFLVFDDCDLDATIDWACVGIFFNAGQVCSATSRLLVQEGVKDRLLEGIVKRARQLRLIDPATPAEEAGGTLMGPIVSAAQKDKVVGFITRALAEEGVTALCGGQEADKEEGRGEGYWVQPTVLVGVKEDSEAWREEIFGPVLCVRTFKTEEEGIAAANNTKYGLAAAVSSSDLERCKRVTRRLRAGIVWSNCNQPAFVQAPWGGYGQSGFGRELGKWGLEEFMGVKAITSCAPTHKWDLYKDQQP